MAIDAPAIAAILGMAVATYATRVGGVWLAGRSEPPRFLARCLRHVPGAVISALVVPAVAVGGIPVAGGGIMAVLVAARTDNVLLASFAGAACLWLLRAILL